MYFINRIKYLTSENLNSVLSNFATNSKIFIRCVYYG